MGIFSSKQHKSLFFWSLIILVILELVSYWSFFNSSIGVLMGGIVVLGAIVLSLKDLKYGLFFVVAELVIGSQGYLFSFDSNGSKISLRIALWIVVMAVWLGKEIIRSIRDTDFLSSYKTLPYWKPLSIFASTLVLGVVVGLISNNNQLFFFLELKRWVYILLLFPLLSTFKSKEDFNRLCIILISAVVMLCLKALVLIYIFSHSFLPLVYDVYAWMRQNLLGEITRWPSGFSRIFMQSQIFLLPAAATFFLITYRKLQNRLAINLSTTIFGFLTTICISVIIASLSRSFWIGGLCAIIVTAICYIYAHHPKLKQIFRFLFISLGALIISTLVLFAIVRFPFPKPSANIDASLLTDRAIKIEAGAASRWSLLPVMLEEIKKSPIWGYGFGKSLTYQTYDPRIVSSTSSGQYTTYAFEWGWLDMWLKFGLLGLCAYLWLVWKMFRDGFKLIQVQPLEGVIVTFSLIALVVVHFFTPYLNHPLGFGYIGLILLFLSNAKHVNFNQN
jgi:hypothetical protein